MTTDTKQMRTKKIHVKNFREGAVDTGNPLKYGPGVAATVSRPS